MNSYRKPKSPPFNEPILPIWSSGDSFSYGEIHSLLQGGMNWAQLDPIVSIQYNIISTGSIRPKRRGLRWQQSEGQVHSVLTSLCHFVVLPLVSAFVSSFSHVHFVGCLHNDVLNAMFFCHVSLISSFLFFDFLFFSFYLFFVAFLSLSQSKHSFLVHLHHMCME